MTTIVIDILHRKIWTDSQCTFTPDFPFLFKLTCALVGWKIHKDRTKSYDFCKVWNLKNGNVATASGLVREIEDFIENYNVGKIIKLKESTVVVIDNHGMLKMYNEYHTEGRFITSDNAFVMGSGKNPALVKLDSIPIEDVDRGRVAIEWAIMRDDLSGGDIKCYDFHIPYQDIYE